MTKITFIGDVHGLFYDYFKILNTLENHSIQLGDMGIGFPNTPKEYNSEFMNHENHKFIRGNHDNPEVCRKHKNYLGNYGITEEGIFYISGAWSIDRNLRTFGVDWWHEEELSVLDFDSCLELYEKEKPEIVISHGCPMEVLPYTSFFKNSYQSRTSLYMSEMLKIHKPKEWIFGHMHTNWQDRVDGVDFICLNELVTYTREL